MLWAIDQKQPYEVSFVRDNQTATMGWECSKSLQCIVEPTEFFQCCHLFEPTKPTRFICLFEWRMVQIFLQVPMNIDLLVTFLTFTFLFLVVEFVNSENNVSSEIHPYVSNGIWYLQVLNLDSLLISFPSNWNEMSEKKTWLINHLNLN